MLGPRAAGHRSLYQLKMTREGDERDRETTLVRPWAGRFLGQPGLLSYVGQGGSSDRHSHHAPQPARPPAPSLSEPVIDALAYLDASLDHSPRLVQAARAANISPSRLTQLFSAQVGIPFRRFVLWLRLRRGAEHVWESRSLTEAAHAAGFSDLAHFSRVCRATFGVAPRACSRWRRSARRGRPRRARPRDQSPVSPDKSVAMTVRICPLAAA